MKAFRNERSAAMAATMVEVLPQVWAEQIERAIDRLKQGKKTKTDQWFRTMWCRQQWRNRKVKGPRIIYD